MDNSVQRLRYELDTQGTGVRFEAEEEIFPDLHRHGLNLEHTQPSIQ